MLYTKLIRIQGRNSSVLGDEAQGHANLPDMLQGSYSPKSVQVTDTLLSSFTRLSCEEQMSVMRQLFSYHCTTARGIDVPHDYLHLSMCAMKNFAAGGKSNVLYSLAKGFGTMRPDQSDTCFPVKRMPFGLVEYMANFFISTPGSTVSFD